MAETSTISWTDATVNFWWGCTKVGPGCDHCYAETWDKRVGGDHWGAGQPRRKIKSAAATMRKLQRTAGAFEAEHGRRRRVFCQSMSDTFDNAVDDAWRQEVFDEIEVSDWLDIQLLTKRIGNVERMVPVNWRREWPAHVQLLITVVNQVEADRDIPKLLDLKERLGIKTAGLSMEPLLGPVDLTRIPMPEIRYETGIHYQDVLRAGSWSKRPFFRPSQPDEPQNYFTSHSDTEALDWIIVGGESGPGARPMHPDWARSLRDQCEAAGVPFHFKQWGEFVSVSEVEGQGKHHRFPDGTTVRRVGKKASGRLLDGHEWNGVPG